MYSLLIGWDRLGDAMHKAPKCKSSKLAAVCRLPDMQQIHKSAVVTQFLVWVVWFCHLLTILVVHVALRALGTLCIGSYGFDSREYLAF